jgi:ABC-type dipeptide/oligopeptide/nickel transport system permease component
VLAYIVRRLLYAIPILIGVNLLTFALFFVVNTPDDMARMQLGVKRVTPEAIEKWKVERGYDKPLLFNSGASGLSTVTDTIFFQKSARMFAGDFGRAEDGRDIAREIGARMGPSLAIALPTFILGLFVTVTFRADARLLPRHRLRFLGRRAVRGDDVDFRSLLHHRRPVPDQQGLAAGADLRLSATASMPGAS